MTTQNKKSKLNESAVGNEISKSKSLLEGLKKNDLEDLVEPMISIDRYQSKMGEDDQILVIAFKALDERSAKDLVEFIESGYEWVLDANQSPATDQKGKVTVFVEFERRTSLIERILTLTDEITRLTGDTEWTFTYYKGEAPIPLTAESLEMIPDSPKKYRHRLMQEQELDSVMVTAGLDPSNRYKKTPQDKDMSFLQVLAGVK